MRNWWRGRNVYGSVSPSGMNFSKSVRDPKSRLARTIKYITDENRKGNFKVTKRDIIEKCWGKRLDVESIHPRWGRLLHNVSNGYGSEFFSLASNCRFLQKYRKGNKVFWFCGPISNIVETE